MSDSVNLFDAAANLNSSPSSRQTGPSKPTGIVIIKAGKCTQNGSDGRVTPLPGKGLLRLHSEDGLLHVQWLAKRPSGDFTVTDDLIVFPEDAKLERISQVPRGRVYAVRFLSTGRRSFYWSQEPKSAAPREAELVKKFNAFIDDPSAAAAAAVQAEEPGALSAGLLARLGVAEDELNGMFGLDSSGNVNGDDNELNDALMAEVMASGAAQPAGPTTPSASNNSSSTPAAAPAAPAPATPVATNTASASSQLAGILSETLDRVNTNQQEPRLNLRHVMRAQHVTPELEEPELATRLPELLQHLPPNTNVVEALRSPPFQQACAQFSAALEGGELAALLMQLGMSPDAATAYLAEGQSPTEALLRAMMDFAQNKQNNP